MTLVGAILGVFSKGNVRCFQEKASDISPELKLSSHQTMRLEGDQRWRMILCQRGMIWVTQENDLEDYVLKPGDMFLITLRGEVVIQALTDACLEITPPLKSNPYRGDFVFFD